MPAAKSALLQQYYREITVGLLIFCLLVVGIYLVWSHRRRQKSSRDLTAWILDESRVFS